MRPSDLNWADMLFDFWFVLVHGDGMEGVVMQWECFETVMIPSSSIVQLGVPTFCLAFASSMHHSASINWAFRFDIWLEMKSRPIFMIYSVHGDGMEGVGVSWEHCETAMRLPSNIEQMWVLMIGLASTLMPSSSCILGAFRFDLGWHAVRFMICSKYMVVARKVLWCHESWTKLLWYLHQSLHRYGCQWLVLIPCQCTIQPG